MTINPNPFKNTVMIKLNNISGFTDANSITMKIYDVTGRVIQHYTGQELMGSGQVTWHGYDQEGRSVPAGVYFVRLENDTRTITKKAILLR